MTEIVSAPHASPALLIGFDDPVQGDESTGGNRTHVARLSRPPPMTLPSGSVKWPTISPLCASTSSEPHRMHSSKGRGWVRRSGLRFARARHLAPRRMIPCGTISIMDPGRSDRAFASMFAVPSAAQPVVQLSRQVPDGSLPAHASAGASALQDGNVYQPSNVGRNEYVC